MDIRSDWQKGLSYVELRKKYHMDQGTAKRYVESPEKSKYTLSEPKPTKMTRISRWWTSGWKKRRIQRSGSWRSCGKWGLSTVVQVATAPFFPLNKGSPGKRDYDVPPPGSAKDHERALAESQRRACTKIRDIALCNRFEYFFTWTFDPVLIDRYDPDAIYCKVRIFLSNAVQRYDFSYVLVPEYHTLKDGEDRPAIHAHGLCNLGSVPIRRAASPSGHELSDNHGRPIYNMPTWKYGFSTCVPLDDQYERTVNYVTEYITKSDQKIFGEWYLSSRGLKKVPDIVPLEPIQYDQFRDSEKLKMHIQNEHQVYPNGPFMLTEEMPPLRDIT